MTPEAQQELNQCVQRIAQILHQDAQAQGLPMGRLEEIEATVRKQVQAHVSPQIGIFFSTKRAHPKQGKTNEGSKVFWGKYNLPQNKR
jgi:hypothetical protein